MVSNIKGLSMCLKIRLGVLGGLAVALLSQSALAVVRRVDIANGSTSGDGSSWGSSAYKYLQDALADADSGDEVWVAATGLYYPTTSSTNRTATFHTPAGVIVLGGFAGSEQFQYERDIVANHTILSGDIDGDQNLNGNSYHILFFDGAGQGIPEINGCVIENGNAEGSGTWQFVGGGALLHRDAAIVNCTFRGNRSTYEGGAIFISNTDAEGTDIVNCVFDNNVTANSSDGRGGAIAIDRQTSAGGPIAVVNSLFHDNFANIHGAGIKQSGGTTLSVLNCTFSQNRVGNNGPSTIYMAGDSNLYINNCITWANGPTDPSGGYYGIAVSTDGQSAGEVSVAYSDLQSNSSGVTVYVGFGDLSLTQVVTGNPNFADPASDDFRLTSTSTIAVDSGNTGAMSFLDTYDVDDSQTANEKTPDLDLTVRVWCCTCPIDMGAYEFKEPCEFDLDDDGDVDGFDLAILLGDWGTCPGSGGCPADFDCNGVVDGFDMGYLLGGWSGDEAYPRECESGESSALGGGSESEPDSAALDEVLAALGLEDHDEFVVWLQLVGIDFAIGEIEQILSE